MKIIALLAVAAVVLAGMFAVQKRKTDSSVPTEVAQAFGTWLNKQNKNYASPSEKNYRLTVFYQNYMKIARHTETSYKLALNKFADLTEEEFVTKYTGLKVNNNKPKKYRTSAPSVKADPTDVDWRTQGVINPVKDQGSCGSCWSFSALGALEPAAKIAGKDLYLMSEQQLVDCSWDEGNQGCNGGWMDSAFDYIIKVGGVQGEATYPYRAVDQKCASDSSKFLAGVQIASYTDVPENNCAALLHAIAQQPVSVAVAANSFQFYSKGVFSFSLCGTGLNHGVTATGYGRDTGVNKDFWTIRNSWGTGWGEDGYMRLDRSIQPKTGMCGICMAASYPTVA